MEWDAPVLNQGEGWTPSGRMLLFEFAIYTDRLSFHLYIGPGPIEIRQKLFEMAQKNHPFKTVDTLGKSWRSIFVRSYLTSDLMRDAPIDQLEEIIGKKWNQFIEHDLPEVRRICRQEEWIWE